MYIVCVHPTPSGPSIEVTWALHVCMYVGFQLGEFVVAETLLLMSLLTIL